jgi:hypothetical protein
VVGSDDVVLVAVADDLEIQVVAEAPAGGRRVGQLPWFRPGEQGVAGVCGDPLGGVNGARVPELDRGGDVGRRQVDDAPVSGVLHGDRSIVSDCGDVPPVAVLHPVGRCDAQGAVVAAGDDGVVDGGKVAVGELRGSGRGGGEVEAVLAGAMVELGNEFAGGGEHDRVGPGGVVGLPCGEHLVGHRGQVADVHSVSIEVEPQRLGEAFAQGQ